MFFPGALRLVKLWTWRLNWRALIVVIAAACAYLVATLVRDVTIFVPRVLERIANAGGLVLERYLRRPPRVRTSSPKAVAEPDAIERGIVLPGGWKISSVSPTSELVGGGGGGT